MESSDWVGAFGSGASGSVNGITGGPASGSKIKILTLSRTDNPSYHMIHMKHMRSIHEGTVIWR